MAQRGSNRKDFGGGSGASRSTYDLRVILGTALQAGSRLATAVIALFIVILLARTLEKDAFGRYSSMIALFQVLDVLVDCGSLQAAVRTVANDPRRARPAVRAAVEFRCITIILSIAIAGALAWILENPQVGCVVVASLAFFSHLAGVGVAVLHADIDYKQSESLRIVGSMLGLLATVALVGAGFRDAGSMLVALYAGTAASNLLLAESVKRNVPPEGAGVAFGAFARDAVALGVGGVVRQAYYSMNPVLALALGGDVAAARFAPAYRLTGFSILLSVYFGSAALPALVRLRAAGANEYKRFARRWTWIMAGAGAAIAGVMYLFREFILVSLFGEDYADSASVLAPMCLTTFIIYIGGFALIRLIAAGRDRAALLVSAAGLAANLITNFALTPRLGAEGAAWASVVTEATVAAGAIVALGSR